jgi:voltage-gated potassium channel
MLVPPAVTLLTCGVVFERFGEKRRVGSCSEGVPVNHRLHRGLMRFAGAMESLRRIRTALAALTVVTMVGTVGYLALGFTFLEALYQTVTTVATVGFREVQPLTAAGQIFTIILIVLGVGTVLYNLGVILEAVTEGHLREHLERRHMDRSISAMTGHVIICGNGRVGRSATEYLVATGRQVVVVDNDPVRLESSVSGVPYIHGDVTDDEVLRKAGIDHAGALIAALDTDADTVYVTLSARAIRPDLVIVARARTAESKQKLLLAGASRAVNPQRIGGRRMAVFALQPQVAEFLDVVMHDEDLDFRIEEIHVRKGSSLAGQSVGELALREPTGALLLAIRRAADRSFEANPPSELIVPEGAILIALGTSAELAGLARLAGR